MSTERPAEAPARRSDLRRIGGLVAGLLIVGFLGWGIIDGWDVVSQYDWQLDPLLMAAAVAVLLVFYAMSGLGFVWILEALGPTPGRRVTMSIWAKSLLGRYVPGNVLMVLGRVVLLYERGVSRRVTLAATVYEQALALAAAGVGAIVYLIAVGGGALAWLAALIPLGLILLHPRIFGPMSSWALRKLRREPLPILLPGWSVARLAAWYLLTGAVSGFGVWLSIRAATGGDVGDPVEVGSAFLLSFALSMVAFIFPSGLGVREGVFAAALARDVPGSVAAVIAVGARLVLTLVELAFIGIAVLVGRRR